MSGGASAGRVVVLDVVGLQPQHVTPEATPNLARLLGDGARPLRPPFPAVTIPSQTTLATGRSPSAHGDVANSEYDRETDTVELWARARGSRNRLWETAREAGVTTGVLFFQHLLGTTADVAVTPKPIEDENHRMLEMHCWTTPDSLYRELRAEYAHFPLHNYWGPIAGQQSSEWILSAAREALGRFDVDMLWVYVPHLDYVGLKHGPGPELDAELAVVDGMVGAFLDDLQAQDRWEETAVVVVSEYGFHGVDTPVFPNRALRDAGLLRTRPDTHEDAESDRATEVDLPGSRAFAVVDHQVAHVYCDADACEEAASILAALDGVDRVLTPDDYPEWDLDTPGSGDLVLVADRNAWFSYYWWVDDEEAPHYATDVDIHSKPGFDPCELWLGDSGLVSTDTSLVGGSHGRVDPEVYGIFAIGGPAAPSLALDAERVVDARSVAPTVADLLGVYDDLAPVMGFERPSLLRSASQSTTERVDEYGRADD